MFPLRLKPLFFIIGIAGIIIGVSYQNAAEERRGLAAPRPLPMAANSESIFSPPAAGRDWASPADVLESEAVGETPALKNVPITESFVKSAEIMANPPAAGLMELLNNSPASTAVAPVAIHSESIVGLNCFYRRRDTGEVFNTGRGSGVIINPRGYILTARHVVDFGFSLAAGGDTNNNQVLAAASDFERCDVGIPGPGTSLPDAGTIRSINPTTQLAVLGYTAKIATSLPPYDGKSQSELLANDYAVLGIDGISSDGPYFGITKLPSAFPFSEILREPDFPPVGDEILTYGFPGDVTSGKSAAFNTLYLVGSVGTVEAVFSDGFIQTKMEVSGGRSGSPLFWRGRVAGIVTSYLANNRAISRSLGVSVMQRQIRKFLP